MFWKFTKIPEALLSPSASFLILYVHWVRAWVAEFFHWNPNWSEMMSSFFSKRLYCLLYIIFSRILSVLESKEIGLQFEHFSLETFSYIGFILLVFKIERNIPEEKDWLNRTATWYMSLFRSFRILVKLLFGPSLWPRFKEEVILKISELATGVIKNGSILSGKR